MKLKNYTTSVPADKSIMEIEKILASFGASAIMKDYLSDGSVRGLAFKYNGKVFKLPANYEGVAKILFKRVSTLKQKEQAYRATWRIIKDWVHSQLSLIVSGQAEPEQALLPYLFDGSRNITFYEAYKKGNLQITGKICEEDEGVVK